MLTNRKIILVNVEINIKINKCCTSMLVRYPLQLTMLTHTHAQ